MKFQTGVRRPISALSVLIFALGLVQGTAEAKIEPPAQPEGLSSKGPQPTPSQEKSPAPAEVESAQRQQVLGSGWKESKDRAWTTSSDASGFHILVADKDQGYMWRTAATLSEPGFDADMWIGNACVTGSGKRVVVAYAPRTFTNKPDLMVRGAFTAVVDLQSGQVDKLKTRSSLAYFSPGCGTGETAVFTQFASEAKNASRLIAVDADRGRLRKPIELTGQVTSAVPVGDYFIAADSARIVKINSLGERETIATTSQTPFLLSPDAEGGVVFMERKLDGTGSPPRGLVKRVRAAEIARPGSVKTELPVLADGVLHEIDLTRSSDGQVFITGDTSPLQNLPKPVRWLEGTPKDTRATTRGEALVTETSWVDVKDSRGSGGEIDAPRPAKIRLSVPETRQATEFEVTPGTRTVGPRVEGGESSPLLTAAADGTIDQNATCAVPRNSTVKHAYQPKPRQVEWAVNQAITGNLNKHISRPNNWKGLGMAPYQPQTLFPLKQLSGGGRVPSQVMLGITAQESNMWQASRVVMPGATGNPLIGNYYGVAYTPDGQQTDPWAIDYTRSDCGYGVTQVTDGMTKVGTMSQLQKDAIALDYTANIAAGVNILIDKWNQTRTEGLTVNDGDPQWAENWFFALWAYNSGYYPKGQASQNKGKWGVGWTNNPANPLWKSNRTPFLEGVSGGDDYSHAAHPQDWPYQEKVLGWAGRPLFAAESPGTMIAGFRPAWWSTTEDRTKVKPPVDLFCTTANECDPSKISPNDQNQPGLGACQRADLYCWWNQPVSWKICSAGHCAYELLRFNDTYGEQADGISYPPNCSTAGLPGNALIIDDVPDNTPMHRPNDCTGPPKATSGSFSFDFHTDSARVDLHQIGAGYSSHFWFTHTRLDGAYGGRLKTTGTWTLNNSMDGWTRVLVHLPDHGAHTQQARYEIDLGDGTFSRHRYINQKRKANNWVSLGVYRIKGTPRVRLGSVTEDGDGSEDVAWDAVAFQPLPGKPKHIVAVLGDSYTSGEGAGSYYAETDTDHGDAQRWNACRRSKNAWARKIVLPNTAGPLGALTDSWSTEAELGFVACSGARTYNVWDAAFSATRQDFSEGQFHEINQMRSGVLSADTTLVTITLGGNDEAAFTKAVRECALPHPSDCSEDTTFLSRYKGLLDNSIIPRIETTLREIAAKAPNAQIVLMGYPELFSRTVKCSSSLYVYMPEAAALAELVNYAGTKQKTLVDSLRTGPSKLKIEYADPVPTFAGHGGCDSDEWINMVVKGPVGDGDFHEEDPVSQANGTCAWEILPEICLSRESFHPKAVGTTGYAQVMQTRLAQIGYQGP
ncbi:hypothetical protein HS048_34960 [Planomonospora sp. ID91781]|uniref:golvesin C-terminal-like domain-containing protein n=1 Tax=Planomonospora sp. ID91781 TaxID=2738135 RepID=UPI0018C3FDDE|nr:GDSL-type esterase/lipase family protein [Planomonospora sp. ID91781]MBG0825879.1 hypothetical protein [Planomonospora sp. ID91781]